MSLLYFQSNQCELLSSLVLKEDCVCGWLISCEDITNILSWHNPYPDHLGIMERLLTPPCFSMIYWCCFIQASWFFLSLKVFCLTLVKIDHILFYDNISYLDNFISWLSWSWTNNVLLYRLPEQGLKRRAFNPSDCGPIHLMFTS